MRRALPIAALAGVAGVSWWWRTHPSACPFGLRFFVDGPHPLITRERLREALAPAPGERLLEVGPGTGYYSLPVAEWLGPDGRLELFDIQQEMLDLTFERSKERGLENIGVTQGDAQELPYEDASFDGAFLVTVLGEVPDPSRAMAELARVVKPGGRLVVGEIVFDPHIVMEGRLRELAEDAGLRFARRVGGPLGFFARLEKPADD